MTQPGLLSGETLSTTSREWTLLTNFGIFLETFAKKWFTILNNSLSLHRSYQTLMSIQKMKGRGKHPLPATLAALLEPVNKQRFKLNMQSAPAGHNKSVLSVLIAKTH